MEFGLVVSLTYVAGWLVAWPVCASRAGLGWNHAFGSDFEAYVTNLPWLGATLAKMFAWPVVLAVWLALGQPASRWAVFRSRGGDSYRIRRISAEEASRLAQERT
ncbi:hypothetical protein [Conexibacter arvalis]|uniref:Uncharacterized protein n=1 Tax=Conexibacter arvalis TaxID=912552 RepID=A0A840IKZ9_9ACTN|nr:hypothetical protein [Conexibacter arvalis]MBB4664813.1 hypothetical protein [Conexibacter arvalis]